MVACQSWCTTKFHSNSILIYINHLSDDLMSTLKLFSDNTSLFSVVRDSNISANDLNNDRQKITEMAYK